MSSASPADRPRARSASQRDRSLSQSLEILVADRHSRTEYAFSHTFSQTSVAKEILSALNHVPNVVILSQDSFYKRHDAHELELAFRSELDFDHPNAIDWERFEQVLKGLRRGEAVEVRSFRPPA
jgi:hypothetical protein